MSGQPSAGPRKRGQPAETARQPDTTPSSPPAVCAATPRAGSWPREQAARGCPLAVRAGARVPKGRGRSAAGCSRDLQGAARREHPHQSAAGPIPRLDAAACSAKAAKRSTRSSYVASQSSCEWNSSISRDLPRPGSPTIRTSWPSPPCARSQRRASITSSSSRPTKGVSVRAPPLRPPPLARMMRKSWTGSDYALELPRASLLGDEEPGHLALDVHGDEHRTWLGSTLNPSCDVRRVAEHLARMLPQQPARTRCRSAR